MKHFQLARHMLKKYAWNSICKHLKFAASRRNYQDEYLAKGILFPPDSSSILKIQLWSVKLNTNDKESSSQDGPLCDDSKDKLFSFSKPRILCGILIQLTNRAWPS